MTELLTRKSLKDLSWNVSEEEYRANPSLSYSKLSQFFKLGPKALISTEKIDTPSLRFGSLVDTILTAPEEFDDRFYVADIDRFSDTFRAMTETIYNNHPDLESIAYTPNLIDYIGDWQPRWGEKAKVDAVVKGCSDYYTVLKYSAGKIVVSPQEFSEAQQCVSALKTSQYSYKVFEVNEDQELLYQLKFKSKLNDIDVRIMTDICRVDHANKTIQIIDLKTSGKEESLFEESFLSWNYMIQASLYKQVLKNIISEDDYFKDFKVLPFDFLVINKMSLKPIIWSCGNDEEHLQLEAKVFDKNKLDWRNLLFEAGWHISNGKFDYPKRIYNNNGIVKINV